MTSIYQQHILDHFKDPENFGQISCPTCTTTDTNPLCGDSITVYLTITDSILSNFKFKGSGCAISIASTSMLSENIIGKNISEILKIPHIYITDLLNIELTPARLKCATLGLNTLKKAIKSKL